MDKLLVGRRILVVEDEMLILMMIETILEDLGCGYYRCYSRTGYFPD
jgi:CheY-like chemotaxis protein